MRGIAKCANCTKKCTFKYVPINEFVEQKPIIATTVSFWEYKPAVKMSINDRSEEAIKRRAIVDQYEIMLNRNVCDDDKRFILKRVAWNNVRIAHLLN